MEIMVGDTEMLSVAFICGFAFMQYAHALSQIETLK